MVLKELHLERDSEVGRFHGDVECREWFELLDIICNMLWLFAWGKVSFLAFIRFSEEFMTPRWSSPGGVQD